MKSAISMCCGALVLACGGAPPPQPDVSAQCGFDLPLSAPPIQADSQPGPAPPLWLAKSLPFEGIYILQSMTAYTPDGSMDPTVPQGSFGVTMRIKNAPNNMLTFENIYQEGTTQLELVMLAHPVGLTGLELTSSCPPSGTSGVEYSFDGTTFVMRNLDGDNVIEQDFVLVEE